MAQFTEITPRIDPYQNFPFRLKWDGREVAGASKCSGLQSGLEIAPSPRPKAPSGRLKLPHCAHYGAITLERGLTLDPEFAAWVRQIHATEKPPDEDPPRPDFRRNLTLEVYRETGQLAIAYEILRCWVSTFHALPTLQARANAFPFEAITLENDGWKRLPAPPDLAAS